MQSDLHAVIGRERPQRIRDRSGRPRFCKYQYTSMGCFDGGRPLADRVYHCSYVAKKSDRDQKMRSIHLPVYDHYCFWIGVIVYLDTMKPYLLTLIFLFLDAIIVFMCSIAGLSLFPQSVVNSVVMVLAAIIVVWLASPNAYHKFRHLATDNITIPEMNQLGRITGDLRGFFLGFFFGFRISLDQTSDEFLNARFVRKTPNPWDLSVWRNLYQVLGGWDCLLPWMQPPRVADYGNPKHEFDFEMSDEFRKWVSMKREELRLRVNGSEPAAVPLDRREEAQSEGLPPAPIQLSPSATPIDLPPFLLDISLVSLPPCGVEYRAQPWRRLKTGSLSPS